MYTRFPSLIVKTGSAGGGSYDSDAQAFFTAAGITSTTEKDAWNTFVNSAKASGYYSKFYYFYPFIGGDSTKHSYNAINTANYQMTWGGTITHNSNGVTAGASAKGSTGFNSGSFFTTTSAHIGVYLNQTGLSGIDIILIDAALGINAIVYNTTSGGTAGFLNGKDTPYTSLSSGLVVANLFDDAGDGYVELYNNSTLVSSTYMGTNSPASGTELIYFGTYLPIYGSTANLRAAWAAQSFTSAQMTAFNTHLQTFQTSLSRNL